MPKQLENGSESKPVGIRVGPDLAEKIAELGRIWGPVVPVTTSDVLRVCVERIHAQEIAKKKISRGA